MYFVQGIVRPTNFGVPIVTFRLFAPETWDSLIQLADFSSLPIDQSSLFDLTEH